MPFSYGGKSVVSSGSASQELKTNIMTKRVFGRQKLYTPTNAANAFTTNFTAELESGFEAVRFGYLNLHTEEISGMKFSMAVSNKNHGASYIQDSTPTGPWIDGVFPTCAARVAPELPSITWTPWISITDIPQANGRPRPLICGRIEMPAGKVCTIPFNGIYGWNDLALSPRMFRAASQAVDGVTTKANWVGGTNPNSPTQGPTVFQNAMMPVIQYVSKVPGKQVMFVGDSTVQGLGASNKDASAISKACMAKSTPDAPIEFFNGGLHSQGFSVYSRGIDIFAKDVAPTHVFYQPWSVNDSIVGGHEDTMIEALKGASGLVSMKLNQLPHPPKILLLEPLPCGTTFKNLGAGDAKRRSFINDYMPTMKYGTQVKGYANVISGVETNGQTQPISSKMFDPAHPNDVGYEDLASVAGKFI